MMTPPSSGIFVLDTNVLIGFSLWLPIHLSSVFWKKLTEALETGRWILLDVVVKEIKYNPQLEKWCKDQAKKGLIKILGDEHRERGVEINNSYQMIDEVTQKSTVDTYLVAYAEANKLIMFSRESPRKSSNDLYKIADVCTILKINRIWKPEDFMAAIGYKN